MDVGCGTGILSFILAGYMQKGKQIHAIDINTDAVRCTDINKNILGLHDKIDQHQIDIKHLAQCDDEKYKRYVESSNINMYYDVIVSNPPWINAKDTSYNTDSESGNYDDNNEILEAVIRFSNKRLEKSGKKGILILLYSDLSYNLGLNKSRDIVSDICNKYEMMIKGMHPVI